MAGETIITIVGNLTRDPELRTTGNGSTVVNFTIASSTRTFNRNTNSWEDGDTLFLNCSAWDTAHAPLASNIAQSLSKGMNVIAQGRLVQRTYETENHERRTVMELRVETIGPSLRRASAQVNRQGANGGFVGGRQGGGPAAGSGAPYQGGATRSTSSSAVSDPWADGNSGFGTTFGARDDADPDDF